MRRRLPPVNQRIRRGLILGSFLLFPVTIFWMSPYLIVDGAARGVVSGSMLLFAAMLVTAIFLGRAWCGWVCPAGGLQDFVADVNGRRAPRKWLDGIKWMLWVPWILLIASAAGYAGGFVAIHPFHKFETGISFLQPTGWFIYFAIILLFGTLALFLGRRGACHAICWMAPFMVIGRRLGGVLGTPQLSLVTDAKRCVACASCTEKCPMSLDVHDMVRRGRIVHDECILCGACAAGCTRGVIQFSIRRRV